MFTSRSFDEKENKLHYYRGKDQFCNGNLNKFVLLLRKCVYPYEDMDSSEKNLMKKPHYQIKKLFIVI